MPTIKQYANGCFYRLPKGTVPLEDLIQDGIEVVLRCLQKGKKRNTSFYAALRNRYADIVGTECRRGTFFPKDTLPQNIPRVQSSCTTPFVLSFVEDLSRDAEIFLFCVLNPPLDIVEAIRKNGEEENGYNRKGSLASLIRNTLGWSNYRTGKVRKELVSKLCCACK